MIWIFSFFLLFIGQPVIAALLVMFYLAVTA